MKKQTVTLVVTDENFDQLVLENPKPVVVHFSADWSGSSDIMHAIVDGLADRFEGEVTFAEIDFGRHGHIAERLGVASVPTLVIFSTGEVVDIIEGMISSSELAEKVRAQL